MHAKTTTIHYSLNCSKYSNSNGWSVCPGITNECKGPPKSKVDICLMEQATICSVSEPNLDKPTHKLSSVIPKINACN